MAAMRDKLTNVKERHECVMRIERQWFTNLSLVQDGDRIASASPKTGGSGEGMPATQYCQIGDLHSVFR